MCIQYIRNVCTVHMQCVYGTPTMCEYLVDVHCVYTYVKEIHTLLHSSSITYHITFSICAAGIVVVELSVEVILF